YVNMGRDLYRSEPVFRKEVDRCSDLMMPLMGIDLRDLIYFEGADSEGADHALEQTAVAQAALFAVEYATAQLLMEWGLSPWAMIGHSIGEYVAACLAGVFSLEDALKIVSARGKLMQRMPPGEMIAVSLRVEDALEIAGDRVSLAAINGNSLVVFSGASDDVEELQTKLTVHNIHFSRLHTSHAFHSEMMEPVLKLFEEQVRAVKLNPPNIRYISNVTGNWITAEEATDPAYWARHMRQTVRFSKGLDTLLEKREGVFLEVGPGRTLSTFASARVGTAGSWQVINTLRPHNSERSDYESLLESVGRLWLSGVNLNWTRFYGSECRRRIPLPGYPFDRKRYWIDFQPPQSKASQNGSVSERVLQPSLHERPPSLVSEYATPTTETEQTLAEIWQAVFGIESVGVNDEFFALGGHSLLATQLIAEVREAFEIE
ncbi:MAG: acyltransferase domain-containing protein, partial [Blastocatellia bacterium]